MGCAFCLYRSVLSVLFLLLFRPLSIRTILFSSFWSLLYPTSFQLYSIETARVSAHPRRHSCVPLVIVQFRTPRAQQSLPAPHSICRMGTSVAPMVLVLQILIFVQTLLLVPLHYRLCVSLVPLAAYVLLRRATASKRMDVPCRVRIVVPMGNVQYPRRIAAFHLHLMAVLLRRPFNAMIIVVYLLS